MVYRFGNGVVHVCACVVALALATGNASGHTIARTGQDPTVPEPYNVDVPSAFVGTDAETAWMVTAIIFIVLFALSIIVCIYLWYLRNAKMKEVRHMQHMRHHGATKDTRNVWYGGGAHM